MEEKIEGLEAGKVLWLQPVHLHFHHGQEVGVRVFWGKGMKPEESFEAGDLTALVADPAGRRREARVDKAGDEQNNVSFPAGNEGIYTVTVESATGIAQVLIPVGHDVSGKGKPGGRALEIIPTYYYEFRHSDTAEMQVLLDGAPLFGAEVKAVSHLYEGPQPYPYRMETNERGIFRFTFREKGHWLFVVHHRGRFATLVVPGVR